METHPPHDPHHPYDLIVIGGGCNGTGIARDAAMRGIRTLLLEKDDFGTGTTGASSRMIHGGARYLLFDRGTTKRSCIDSGYIQQIAPHMLLRIPFLIPYLPTRGNFLKRFWKDRIYRLLMDAYFEGYDRYQVHKNGKKHVHLTREQALRVEPGLHPEILGAMTMDEWWIDVFRLCLLNALSAEQHGATLKTGIKATALLRNAAGHIHGVATVDQLTGVRRDYFAKIVFNATGPWSPELAKRAKAEVKLRPGKGTHIVLDRRISNWAISTTAIDGRQVYTMPDDNNTLIGCTDDDYYGDMDQVRPTQDEIQYMLEGIESVYPEIRKARVIRAFSGVRPTLFAWGKDESRLSRAHKIFDHSQDGAPGLYSIAGGKLATFRLMAEEATDVIAQALGNHKTCRTHLEALPGGEHTPDPDQLAHEFGLSPWLTRRLVLRHGARSLQILEQGQRESHGYAVICRCDGVMQCELRYVLRHEHVRRGSDLSRRTRLGTGACMGMCCTRTAAQIFCEEKQRPQDIDQVTSEMQQHLWAEQTPILSGTSLRQAALHHHLKRR